MPDQRSVSAKLSNLGIERHGRSGVVGGMPAKLFFNPETPVRDAKATGHHKRKCAQEAVMLSSRAQSPSHSAESLSCFGRFSTLGVSPLYLTEFTKIRSSADGGR